MKEYKVFVCVRIRGEERFRLYIECAQNKKKAIQKAVTHAEKESLVTVPKKSWVIK